MSHSVEVTLIADQEIEIQGRRVNVHNIKTILVNPEGKIIDAYLEPEPGEKYEGWLSEECRKEVKG